MQRLIQIKILMFIDTIDQKLTRLKQSWGSFYCPRDTAGIGSNCFWCLWWSQTDDPTSQLICSQLGDVGKGLRTSPRNPDPSDTLDTKNWRMKVTNTRVLSYCCSLTFVSHWWTPDAVWCVQVTWAFSYLSCQPRHGESERFLAQLKCERGRNTF